MPGYTGYHTNKQGRWSAATIAAVVGVHLVLAVGVYRISQTEYIQNLIKVSKLTTVQEPVKPPDPSPPQEQEPKPDSPPETPPDTPPIVEELSPDPIEPQAPAEDQPSATPSVGEGSDPPPEIGRASCRERV